MSRLKFGCSGVVPASEQISRFWDQQIDLSYLKNNNNNKSHPNGEDTDDPDILSAT